jgi:hypothetical protein
VTELLAIVSIVCELMEQERPPQPPIAEFSDAIGRFMGEIRAFVGVVEPTAAAAPGP